MSPPRRPVGLDTKSLVQKTYSTPGFRGVERLGVREWIFDSLSTFPRLNLVKIPGKVDPVRH